MPIDIRGNKFKDANIMQPGDIINIEGNSYLITEEDLSVSSDGIAKRYSMFSLKTGRRFFGKFPGMTDLIQFLWMKNIKFYIEESRS